MNFKQACARILYSFGLMLMLPVFAIGQTGNAKVINDLDLKQLKIKIESASDEGLMPIDGKAMVTDNVPTFSLSLAKAEPGKIWIAKTEMTDEQFWEQHERSRPAQMKLVCHREYLVGERNRHFCIWQFNEDYGPLPDYGKWPETERPAKDLSAKKIWDAKSEIPMTGEPKPAFFEVDRALADLMKKHHFPGISIAVSRSGEIVYQRGLGYSNLDALVTMKPNQPIRLFECGRPITSAAIMKLVERKKLKLDTLVFDFLKIELPVGADPNLKKITVYHLLRDTAGFTRLSESENSKSTFDPVRHPERIGKAIGNEDSPVSEKQLVDYILAQPLAFEPGTERKLSKFGYLLLGKVIEKASGVSYDEFVQKNLLAVLGPNSFSMAKSSIEDRHSNEVSYYHRTNLYEPQKYSTKDFGKWVPASDAINMEMFGAAGGWVATPTDLLKFAAKIREKRNPILSALSVAKTFEIPQYAQAKAKGKNQFAYFAAGWYANDRQFGRSYMIGGTTGAVSVLQYKGNGVGWVIATNRLATAENQHAANVFNSPKVGLEKKIMAAVADLNK